MRRAATACVLLAALALLGAAGPARVSADGEYTERELLVLALEASGGSYVVGPGFERRVAVRWTNRHWDEALSEALAASSAQTLIEGGVLVVRRAPFPELWPRLPPRSIRIEPAPVSNLDEVAVTLRHLVSDGGVVLADTRTRQLVLLARPYEQSHVEQVLSVLARPADAGIAKDSTLCACPGPPPAADAGSVTDGEGEGEDDEPARPDPFWTGLAEDGRRLPNWPADAGYPPGGRRTSLRAGAPAQRAVQAWARAAGLELAPLHLEGELSLHLREMPASQALAALSKALEDSLRVDERAGRVYRHSLYGCPEEPRIRIIPMSNRPAAEVVPFVKLGASGQGWVTTDSRLNALIVSDFYASLERMGAIAARLDAAGPARACWCPAPPAP